MRRRMRILALAAVLAFGPGCFVIDELDAGMDLMDEVSAGRKKPSGEPAPETAADEKKANARVAVSKWWKSARTPSSGPKDPATATEIVTCRLDGQTLFMSKTDCEVQGGRF
jgi:hypothetical protein